MSDKLIRAAVKSLASCRPCYGTPQSDGSFIEIDGTIHPAGSWWRSKQAPNRGGQIGRRQLGRK